MICDRCEKERKESDFLKDHFYCYHCIYEIKIENLKKKNSPRHNKCRVCRKSIAYDVSLKKRQRNVFCSNECALIGHKEVSDSHWTRKLRTA